jgi:hypothetical protein
MPYLENACDQTPVSLNIFQFFVEALKAVMAADAEEMLSWKYLQLSSK